MRSMSPYGQRWSLEQVRSLLKSKGITENCINWYLVMNMVYNDNMNTASMVGMQADENFFLSLACDFINDPDAKPLKVEKYFSTNAQQKKRARSISSELFSYLNFFSPLRSKYLRC